MSASIRSSTSTFFSASPSCEASSLASTWTTTRSTSPSVFDRVTPLRGVISVDVAGRTGHVDDPPAQQPSQSAEQIDGRDHRSGLAKPLDERLERRRLSQAPQPNLRGRQLVRSRPLLISRGSRQYRHAAIHQRPQLGRARTPRQMIGNRLIGNVVRRSGRGLAAERGRLTSRAVQQQVAVTDPRMKFPGRAAALIFLQPLNQLASQVAGNLCGREAPHSPVGDVDQVAADGPVERTQLDSLGGRLDRRTARVEALRVVAEEAHRPHIAARRHRHGHMVGLTDQACPGDGVHVRRTGRLERRATAERFLPLVRRSVGDNQGVLHRLRKYRERADVLQAGFDKRPPPANN